MERSVRRCPESDAGPREDTQTRSGCDTPWSAPRGRQRGCVGMQGSPEKGPSRRGASVLGTGTVILQDSEHYPRHWKNQDGNAPLWVTRDVYLTEFPKALGWTPTVQSTFGHQDVWDQGHCRPSGPQPARAQRTTFLWPNGWSRARSPLALRARSAASLRSLLRLLFSPFAGVEAHRVSCAKRRGLVRGLQLNKESVEERGESRLKQLFSTPNSQLRPAPCSWPGQSPSGYWLLKRQASSG